MRRIRPHLSYANAMATIAMFIALGGGAYAAGVLPRNSVGSAQIRTHAVGSSELARGAVHLTNIAPATRNSLHGATGPQGPQGPAGTAAVSYFAVVDSGGVVQRGNALDAHTGAGSGSYTLTFPTAVSGCAYSATLGTTNATQPPMGRIGVRDDGGKVGVQIWDTNGTPTDLPFHLIVAC